jgi:GDP-L-fucose synthase
VDPSARIFVAGHRGLIGLAVLRRLRAAGCTNLLTASRQELDLRNHHDGRMSAPGVAR